MHDHDTIPLGLCGCGCGQATRVPTRTDPAKGSVAGRPNRFVKGHGLAVANTRRLAGPKLCAHCRRLIPAADFDVSAASGRRHKYCRACRLNVGADTTAINPDVDPAFGHWLAGFIAGEGCFLIRPDRGSRFNVSFYLAVREDDRAILEEVCERTGLGHVRARKVYNDRWHDQAAWRLTRKVDCVGLVRLLDRFPLRAKKSRDYAIWRAAVLHWAERVDRTDWEQIRFYAEELAASRR